MEVLFNGRQSYAGHRNQEGTEGSGAAGTLSAGWMLSGSSACHEKAEWKWPAGNSGQSEPIGGKGANDSPSDLAQRFSGAQSLCRYHQSGIGKTSTPPTSTSATPLWWGLFYF